VEILLVQALAFQTQGRLPQALAALEQAVVLAEPEGYVQVFVAEGQPVKELLAQLKAENRTPIEYMDKLLAAFPAEAPGAGNAKTGQPARPARNDESGLPVEPLSERELEVLKLLASELSGPEIANYLIVSLNTLRTHTKNIYYKLGVNTRRAAVRRAGELHLLA
jgi:LuxR family maltose regulon positive regulatory protein